MTRRAHPLGELCGSVDPIMKYTYTTMTIQLPTEPSYWGSPSTPTDVVRILDNLESMIRSEFGDRYDLVFERTQTPQGSGVHPDDGSDGEEIYEWIQNNWGAAL